MPLVALAGFYFGTKAVSTAMGNQKNEQEDIMIQSVSFSSVPTGATTGTPSVTLLLQSSVGATLGGIIIADSTGNTVGHFAASDVIPNNGKLTSVTSSSWTPNDSAAKIIQGTSYTAIVKTTKGTSVSSSSVNAK